MSIKQLEERLDALQSQLEHASAEQTPAARELVRQLTRDCDALCETAMQSLTAADRVHLARNPGRPCVTDYINALCTDFFPLSGDRRQGDDESILGGLALYRGMPVTVLGHRKGKTLDENMRYRFGMPNPEGYRKAERLMRQADKFGRPVLAFIDTPGAYPGLEAEARGQGEAIARCLAAMSSLSVPVVAVVIGEGGSGGALAIGVADRLLMLENAVFSILSPEGFATIVWKDAARWEDAAALMKLTAQDLVELGIADEIVPEPPFGAHRAPQAVFASVDEALQRAFAQLRPQSGATLRKRRYERLRAIGGSGKEPV